MRMRGHSKSLSDNYIHTIFKDNSEKHLAWNLGKRNKFIFQFKPIFSTFFI